MSVSRSRILRGTGALATVMALGILTGYSTALANNDPHRTYGFIPPQTMPAGVICAFQVDVTFPLNREYFSTATLPDGSTEIHSTGSLVVTLTNDATRKNITVNSGGPGTFITSADGTTTTIDYQGHSTFFAPNLTAFGFPSNFVLTSGLIETTETAANGVVLSLQRAPKIDLDICAALS